MTIIDYFYIALIAVFCVAGTLSIRNSKHKQPKNNNHEQS